MKSTVIAMGLPKTGKTTFLAAFWHVIGSGDVVGSLRMARTFGDMEYLNHIREAWADCNAIGRTGPAADRPVTIVLEHEGGAETVSLEWTDMIGERFERQWTDREWTRGYQELVESAVGLLVFLHPYKVRTSDLIIDTQATVRRVQEEQPHERVGSSQANVVDALDRSGRKPEAEALFEARDVPTQVQMIDLLQFVDSRRSQRGRLRLGVVVSAWDVVKAVAPVVTPSEWMRKATPLLHQFIEANDDRFDSRIYGVSAQGGDYQDADALRRAHHQPSGRVEVACGTIAPSHDITAPVRWAIGLSAGA